MNTKALIIAGSILALAVGFLAGRLLSGQSDPVVIGQLSATSADATYAGETGNGEGGVETKDDSAAAEIDGSGAASELNDRGTTTAESLAESLRQGDFNEVLYQLPGFVRKASAEEIAILLKHIDTAALDRREKRLLNTRIYSAWAEKDPAETVRHIATIENVQDRKAALKTTVSVMVESNISPTSVDTASWLESTTISSLDEIHFSSKLLNTLNEVTEAFLLEWTRQNPESAIAVLQPSITAAYFPSGFSISDRNQARTAFATLATKGDIEEVSKQLAAFEGSDGYQAAAEGFLEGWSKQDPAAAIAWYQERVPGQLGDNKDLEKRLVRNWAKEDPATALAYNEQAFSGRDQRQLVPGIISEWAFEDVDAAAAWLSSETNARDRGRYIRNVVQTMASQDPETADRLIAGLPDREKPQLQAAIAYQIAQDDPDAAFTYLSTIGNARTWEQAIQSYGRNLYRQDPDATLAYVSNYIRQPETTSSVSQKLVERSLQQFAMQDPDLAIPWLNTLADSLDDPDGAYKLAFRTWGNGDPESAARYLQTLPDLEKRAEYAADLTGTWAKTNPEGAIKFASAISDEAKRTNAISAAMTTWANAAPLEAAAFVESMPESTTRERAAEQVVKRLAESDPAEAASWMAANVGDDSTTAHRNLMNAWLKSDSVAASEWANSLPEGPARDSAVTTLVRNIINKDPESAVVWAETLSTPEARQAMLDTIANRLDL